MSEYIGGQGQGQGAYPNQPQNSKSPSTNYTVEAHLSELDATVKRLQETLSQITNIGDKLLGATPETALTGSCQADPPHSTSLMFGLQRRHELIINLISECQNQTARIYSALGDGRA
jgi:hypothetical protein